MCSGALAADLGLAEGWGGRALCVGSALQHTTFSPPFLAAEAGLGVVVGEVLLCLESTVHPPPLLRPVNDIQHIEASALGGVAVSSLGSGSKCLLPFSGALVH